MTLQRLAVLAPRLLGVGVDEGVDALHQRVREPLLDRPLAPLLGLLFRDAASPAFCFSCFAVSRPAARSRRAGG